MVFTVGLFVMLAQSGCGSQDGDDEPAVDDRPTASVTEPPASTTQPPAPQPATATTDGGKGEIVGTIVRFSSSTTSVDVTIGEDNPAVRDFLSMLPLTITLEEFAGREKIGYPPRELGPRLPGSDPENGDLIYFVPWGNLGFYYNAEGIGYSDDTVHFGTYNASLDELERLEGKVTVEVID